MGNTDWQPSTLSLAFVGSMLGSGFVYPLSMGDGVAMAVPYAIINALLAIAIVVVCTVANNARQWMLLSNRGERSE